MLRTGDFVFLVADEAAIYWAHLPLSCATEIPSRLRAGHGVYGRSTKVEMQWGIVIGAGKSGHLTRKAVDLDFERGQGGAR
jgi:hypothetical protein